MKKLLVIVAACALLLGMAVPAMADMSWGGGIIWSYITGFDPEAGKGASGYYWSWTDVTFTPDDYNTIYAAFGSYAGFAKWGPDQFYVSTDVGSLLGLPIGVTNKAGMLVFAAREFQASASGVEMFYEIWTSHLVAGINGWNLGLDLGAATANVYISIGDNFGAVAGQTAPAIAAIFNVPEAGPADIEAYYIIKGSTEFKGVFGANAKLALGFMDAAVGFAYDVAETTGWDWMYGVGVSLPVSIATLSVGIDGDSADILDDVGIVADAGLTDLFGATAAVGLALGEGDDAFQGADVSAYLTAGDATWRLGYIITDLGYAWGSVAGLPEGGLYTTVSISW
jgi:hypothetical protein